MHRVSVGRGEGGLPWQADAGLFPQGRREIGEPAQPAAFQHGALPRRILGNMGNDDRPAAGCGTVDDARPRAEHVHRAVGGDPVEFTGAAHACTGQHRIAAVRHQGLGFGVVGLLRIGRGGRACRGQRGGRHRNHHRVLGQEVGSGFPHVLRQGKKRGSVRAPAGRTVGPFPRRVAQHQLGFDGLRRSGRNPVDHRSQVRIVVFMQCGGEVDPRTVGAVDGFVDVLGGHRKLADDGQARGQRAHPVGFTSARLDERLGIGPGHVQAEQALDLVPAEAHPVAAVVEGGDAPGRLVACPDPLDRPVASGFGGAGGEGNGQRIGRPGETADSHRPVGEHPGFAAAGLDHRKLRLALGVGAQEGNAQIRRASTEAGDPTPRG